MRWVVLGLWNVIDVAKHLWGSHRHVGNDLGNGSRGRCRKLMLLLLGEL